MTLKHLSIASLVLSTVLLTVCSSVESLECAIYPRFQNLAASHTPVNGDIRFSIIYTVRN